MIAERLVTGSQTPTCRLCSYLRRMEVDAAVFDGSAPRAAQWRLRQSQHIAAAHRPLEPRFRS